MGVVVKIVVCVGAGFPGETESTGASRYLDQAGDQVGKLVWNDSGDEE